MPLFLEMIFKKMLGAKSLSPGEGQPREIQNASD